MALITRQEKGSKLTIQEMDGNLEYLASSSFQDGEYSQISGSDISTITVTPTITSIISADGDITQNGSVLGISDSTLDPFTISNGATGSYVISEPETSGNGSGLEIELLIYGTSGISMSIDLTGSSVIEGGNGYAVGDELYIYASQIGGTGEEDFITITLGEGDVNIIPYGALAVSPKQTLLTAGNSVVINLNSKKGISLTSDNGNSTDITIGSEVIKLNAPTLILAGELDTTQLILPTTDPGSLGQLWVDTENGFVLKVSTGS